MAPGSPPDRLSSDEVALVLRRAADLEAHAAGRAGADDGFDTTAVEEAAREVGLSPTAVRQALAELRTGALVVDSGGRAIVRTDPAVVKVARVVPKPPAAVHTTADSYLRRQTFELRRRQDQTVLYRQRRDTAAKVRRAVDLNGAIQLEMVDAITLTTTPVDRVESGADADETDRSMVHIVAEVRNRTAVATVANGLGLTVAGTTALVGLLVGAPAVAVATLVVGAGAAAGELTVRRKKLRRRRHQVAEVLDGLLDSLERPALPY